MKAIFQAAGAPIVWDEQHIGTSVDERTNSFVTRENLDSVLVSAASARVSSSSTCDVAAHFSLINTACVLRAQLVEQA